MIDPTALGLDVSGIHGDEAIVLCPFHNDHRPTNASFNVKKGLFHCFACGKNANSKQLALYLGGQIVGLPDTSFLRRAKDENEWRHLLSAPLAIDHPYMKTRGITNDEIERFSILEINEDFVGIPAYDTRGRNVAIILRRIPDIRKQNGHPRLGKGAAGGDLSWLSHSKSRYILLGQRPSLACLAPDCKDDKLLHDKRLILVEGIFGAIRARRFDLQAYPALGATPSRRTMVAISGRAVTAIYDDDFAGYVGAARITLSSANKSIIPGIDFDTIDTREDFERTYIASHLTSDIDELGRHSGDIHKFYRALEPWLNKK
jgi:hypothetical protein